MKDRSDDLSYHEQTLLPQSYISLLVDSESSSDEISVRLIILCIQGTFCYMEFDYRNCVALFDMCMVNHDTTLNKMLPGIYSEIINSWFHSQVQFPTF